MSMACHAPLELPIELDREVFEVAASEYPSCAVRLMLVARRVHQWIEPMLYRVLRSNNVKNSSLSLYANNSKKSLNIDLVDKFAPYVRHVLMQTRPVEEVADVLKRCPQIQNLALWIIRGVFTPLIPIIESLPLRQLSFDPSCFFMKYEEDIPIPFDQPMFRGITHLEIINVTPSWTKWQELPSIPRLSHLALAGVVSTSLITHILDECASLERLVIYYFAGMSVLNEGGELPHIDGRVVVLPSLLNPSDRWEREARGLERFFEDSGRKSRRTPL